MPTSTMKWEKPTAIEIKMDAEISSYQEEDPFREGPLFSEPSVQDSDAE